MNRLVAPVLLVFCACMHRHGDTPNLLSLPAPVPPISGDMRTLYTLRYIDIAPGTGALAEPAKCYYVHYTGWLTDGKKFDSSRDTTANGQRRTPLAFEQGKKAVIAGWDTGFEGMRVGGKGDCSSH